LDTIVKKSSRHVEPNVKGGWSVRSSGSFRASRIFDTQAEAIAHARWIAEREESALYVHRQDGSILEKREFGDGPPDKGA